MLARPQAYAEYLQRELGGPTALSAPLLVIAPTGFGVSGRELRSGRLQPCRPRRAGCPFEGSTSRPPPTGTRSPAPPPSPYAGSPPPQGGRCRRTSRPRVTSHRFPPATAVSGSGSRLFSPSPLRARVARLRVVAGVPPRRRRYGLASRLPLLDAKLLERRVWRRSSDRPLRARPGRRPPLGRASR